MKRTIVTVVGKDTVGIMARVCTFLAEQNVNILDITQTIVQGFFNMMMIVDVEESRLPFEDLEQQLDALADEIGIKVRCQREDIFTSMHRV